MPLKNKDYYKILQVDPSAEQEVIEAAYRRLARMYHPDISLPDTLLSHAETGG
jgi:DnaJ-class molecular chaperone